MAEKHAKKSDAEQEAAPVTDKKAAAKKDWAKVEAKEKRRKRVRGVLIGAFSVIIALSMMLPSLSYIVMGMQSDTSANATASTEQSTPQSLDDLEKSYQPQIDELSKTLEEKPDDASTLRSLGSYYMSWAYEGSSFAVDDASSKTVSNLFQKAIEYYDKYLGLEDLDANDRNSVRADRALCQFYAGDAAGGTDALRELTKDSPDYAYGWADLGLVLESTGDTDGAKEAYQKAAELDSEGTTVKSFAEGRIQALEAAAKDAEKTEESAEDSEADAKDDAKEDAAEDGEASEGTDTATTDEAAK